MRLLGLEEFVLAEADAQRWAADTERGFQIYLDLETSSDVEDFLRRFLLGQLLALKEDLYPSHLNTIRKAQPVEFDRLSPYLAANIRGKLLASFAKTSATLAQESANHDQAGLLAAIAQDFDQSDDFEQNFRAAMRCLDHHGVQEVLDHPDQRAQLPPVLLGTWFWLIGDIEAATLEFERGAKAQDFYGEWARWRFELLKAIFNADFLQLNRQLKKKQFESMAPYLEGMLVQIIFGETSSAALSTSKIARIFPRIKQEHPAEFNLFKVLQFIEGLDRKDLAFDASLIAQLQDLPTQMQRLPELVWEVLGWAAVGATVSKLGKPSLARHFHQRYADACLRLSQGRSENTLGLQINKQAVAPRKQTTTGSMRRAAKLLGTSVRVAERVMNFQTRQLVASGEKTEALKRQMQHEISAIVDENFSEMRGALLKLVQVGGGFEMSLPYDVRERLKGVYMNAEPESPEMVRRTWEKEFGGELDQVISNFDPVPVGTGAVAQVHHGETKQGRSVAIKFLATGIADTIRSDVKIMSSFSWLLKQIRHDLDYQEIMKYWQGLMLQETDFKTEVYHQELFRFMFKSHPTIEIPRVLNQLSGQKVITMEYFRGQSFYDFCKTASQERRNQACRDILEFHLNSIREGFFKHDIHPGNYLFSPDKTCIVDYGAVLDDRSVNGTHFEDWFDTMISGEPERYLAWMRSVGMEYTEKFDAQKAVDAGRNIILRPFMIDEEFEFTPEFAASVYDHLTKGDENQGAYTLPFKIIPVIRIYFSLYNLLGQIRGKGRWGDLLFGAEHRSKDLSA